MYGGDDQGWGGGGHNPYSPGLPSYLGFGPQTVNPAMASEDRMERQDRIEPFFDPIKNGAHMSLPKNDMLELIKDFKKEGNDLFKDKNYVRAGDHYTCALLMGHMLQTEHHEEVDKELLSTLFSNRAACFLKMDMYPTGIEDCNIAIGLNKANIKAYYRKATAYKTLKKYEDAANAATIGRDIAENRNKKSEVQEFDYLLREINSHLTRSSDSAPTAKAATASKQSTKPKQSAMPQAKKYTAAPQKKATISAKEVLSSNTKDVDEDWLVGTNVNVTKKAKAQTKSQQTSKKKKETRNTYSRAQYKGNYASLQPESSTEDEDDEDDDEEDDESSDSGVLTSTASATSISGNHGAGAMGNSHAHLSNVQQQFLHTQQAQQSLLNKAGGGGKPTKQSRVQHEYFTGGMGLDEDFGLPSNVTTAKPKQPPQVHVPQPKPQPGPKFTQGLPLNLSAAQKKPIATGTKGFTAIVITQKPIPYPFNSEYDFTFACYQCYIETGIGPDKYRSAADTPHQCTKEIFLCRRKDNHASRWVMVRDRPKTKFLGSFRLCQQYSTGIPCKVPTLQCSFAHNEVEVHLWTLDRNSQIDLKGFVVEWSNYAKSLVPQRTPDIISNPSVKQQPIHVTMQQGFKPPAQQQQQKQQSAAVPSLFAQQHQPTQQFVASTNQPRSNHPQQQPSSNNQSWYEQSQHLENNPPQQQNYPPPGQPQNATAMQNARGRPNQDFTLTSHLKRDDGSSLMVERYVFPLKDSHKMRIVCQSCIQRIPMTFNHWTIINLQHRCSEDTLAVQLKTESDWTRIRERSNHRAFRGNYVLCRFYSSDQVCMKSEKCCFAHSREEQYLWTLEKDEYFNLTEFILQNRAQSTDQFYNIEDLFRKHPGWFQFICGACFYTRPPRISIQNSKNPNMCSNNTHNWANDMLLVHVKTDTSEITPVAERPFKHAGCFFLLCHKMQFCIRKQKTGCRFAHSLIERDVWLLERDSEIRRDELVEKSLNFLKDTYMQSTNQIPPQQQQQQAAPTANGTRPRPTAVPAAMPTAETEAVKCPFRIVEVCGLCWRNGNKIRKDKSRYDRCAGSGMGHMWGQNKAAVLVPENKIIRPLPKRIPSGFRFIICKHVREKKKCDYSLGGFCQFAHSEQEVEVWTWMVKNNVTTLDDLVKASSEAQAHPSSATKAIPKGQTVVWAKPVAAKPSKLPEFQLTVNALYCHYCSIQCNSQKQWEEHCASEKHLFNLNTDKEHQWNYRQPPWGVRAGHYELCKALEEGKKCRYSDKPDMFNFCKYAHSQAELDEWKERWEWRQMKRDVARLEHMYSFMEELLEEYEMTDAGISVISEEIDHVEVDCESELNIFLQHKQSEFVWKFQISTLSRKPLQRVALLHNQGRLHFSLLVDYPNPAQVQISPGESFLTYVPPPGGGDPHYGLQMATYEVQVKFTGGIFGSFMQWVAFDFGTRPVLVRKLGVELGSQATQEKVLELREQMAFDRWTGDNRVIVRYDDADDAHTESFPDSLLRRYKPPSSADAVVTHQSVATSLNQHNYVHKMHKLLEIEEITRAQIIASYNLKTEIELTSVIQEFTYINASPGELFAKVPLNDQLTEDTDAGKLILSSVGTVLLALEDAEDDDRVYEAVMVRKDNFDYDGRGRDYIYICLSPRCVRDLELQDGSFCNIELQFKMNRLPFCQMHFAVDCLSNNDVVFPDISKISATSNENRVFRVSSDALNEDQLRIVEHIMAERPGYAPPIVVYGPFGTGKTETLAQAAMLVIKENYDARVLICCQSNSAADLYITKHFDAFAKKNQAYSILRVYSKERRINTVPATVKKYCLLSRDNTKFMVPVRENILSHHIVITTLTTSLAMSKLRDLKGYFTHIFVDEAAQAFECEAIMPLSMATDNTCVVLAGDHLQMSPKVYSKEAKNQKFHRSLLERLYRHYDDYHRGPDTTDTSPLNILLTVNYRTKMEIVRFLSAIYYGGPDKLHAASGIPDVDDVKTLNFYTAQGQEVQDPDSVTYYNNAEVEEVVARVAELYEAWPEEWGERKADSIGVLSPYTEQVNRIRMALRKKKLNGITVDRVMNIQGKEFRALFLSTVRTIRLADTSPVMNEITESDGDVGDFGFLSDNKLLNTALTRAQSFVGVVGDPVALCVIGDCASVWRAYLKHCQNLCSIFPDHVTLESIRAQVVNLMNSPKGQNIQMLNALSQEMKEKKFVPSQKQAKRTVSVNTAKKVSKPRTPPIKGSKKVNPFEVKPMRSISIDGDWSIDLKVESEDILKKLAKDAVKEQKQEMSQEEKNGSNQTAEKQEDEGMTLKYFRVKENEGHAVLEYIPPAWADQTKKRQLMGADDHDKQFDYEDHLEGEDEEVAEEGTVYVDFSVTQLMDMIQNQPEKYKLCFLQIENSRNMHAKIKYPTSRLKEIKITSRLKCGRAFNNDEVVVEILDLDEEDASAQGDDDKQIPQGNVVGIIKRAINPQYRLFVCMVEEGNTGLMVPLNRGIPKIFNLENKTHLKKTKRGHVCVYSFTKDKDIEFDHYEAVDPSDPHSKLFVVRYLKWDAEFYSPLGIVVGTMPAGNTIQRGLDILDIEYFIPKKFKDATQEEIDQLKNFRIPPTEIARRIDFRDRTTFTIDPPGSEDLDDALSVDEMANGSVRIGVHIADVSYFVKKGSAIDVEASSRGTTYYPAGGEPIPMLPTILSNNLCSLKPRQDRLTLSMFLTVNANAQIVDTQVRQTVINSKYKLEYADVEKVLNGEFLDMALDDKVKNVLPKLYHIANRWRRVRIGNEAMYQNLEPEAAQTSKAHILVEEMMIMTNHQVCMVLMQNFPTCTPLRIQMPPDELALDEWRQKYREEAKNTIALTRPFLPRGQVCNCVGSCTCIQPIVSSVGDFISVRKEVWQNIMSEISNKGSLDSLVKFVCSPEQSPETTVAMFQLRYLQERGIYVNTVEAPEDLQHHYSLNMHGYTHFTSPIRRYIDLVVHRLLLAVITIQSSPYTEDDIINICSQCTDAALKAKRYEQATERIQLSMILQNNPAVLYPVVESLDESQMQLRFPTISAIPFPQSRVQMPLLKLAEKPQVEDNVTNLHWQERIYDTSPKSVSSDVSSLHHEANLNPDRFVVKIPVQDWRLLMFSVVEGERNKILNCVDLVNKKIRTPNYSYCNEYAEDVTSEVQNIHHSRHFCEFSLDLMPAKVMKVQVTSELFKGYITPKMQLLELTPTLDICLEHRSNPVSCFANKTTIQASKPQYRDLDSYRNSWLRVLAIESAHSSANNGDAMTVHNIDITWQKFIKSGNEVVYGTFQLPLQYCSDRQINFSSPGHGSYDDDDDSDEEDEEDVLNQNYLDYFCVRYSNLTPGSVDTDQQPEKFDIDFQQPVSWVSHCLSTKKRVLKKEGIVHMTLQLHQSSIQIPEQLLFNEKRRLATIEFIPKSLPNRRQEAAIRGIVRARKLAKDIALGRKIDSMDEEHLAAIKDFKHVDVPNLNTPNQAQQFAITNALTQAFTLIQGPPGTGKTVTGVRIAYLFAQFNKTRQEYKPRNGAQGQILYCGPSNKSVDVVTAYFKKLGASCPNIVRVYNESIERQDFPLPTDPVSNNSKRYTQDPSIQELALHHQIRDPSRSPYAKLITELDAVIRNCRDNEEPMEEDDMERYRIIVSAAESEVLKTKEIVLCTCNASMMGKIRASTNIKQLIVDECGMCTEPESMVPIVSSLASQVVLIGDHKQLRPIVLESRARDLGLETSLFERYQGRALMLTTQYRMHESIAEFPSRHFYDNKLDSGLDEQTKPSTLKFWPNGRSKPLTFVHILGREEMQTVATSEGSELSRSNMDEVAQAVRAATQLVRRFHVNPRDVVILSQYRAQCARIEEALVQKGERDIAVNTVVAAQGSEWDYVILSTVRSLPKSEIEQHPTTGWCRRNLGFITDEHQINVAITRARKGQIILGNKYLLSCNHMWNKLLHHYQAQRKVLKSGEFMS